MCVTDEDKFDRGYGVGARGGPEYGVLRWFEDVEQVRAYDLIPCSACFFLAHFYFYPPASTCTSFDRFVRPTPLFPAWYTSSFFRTAGHGLHSPFTRFPFCIPLASFPRFLSHFRTFTSFVPYTDPIFSSSLCPSSPLAQCISSFLDGSQTN